MPGDLWDSYTLGTVDDALGLYAHDPSPWSADDAYGSKDRKTRAQAE